MEKKPARKSKLNPEYHLHVELAKKYQVPPIVIAYLRSALMRKESRYVHNTKALIEHIMLENPLRKKEIAHLEKQLEFKPSEEKRVQVRTLEEKYQTRDIALLVLNNISADKLEDILQLEEKQADTVSKDIST